jgi:hypothetical protein
MDPKKCFNFCAYTLRKARQLSPCPQTFPQTLQFPKGEQHYLFSILGSGPKSAALGEALSMASDFSTRKPSLPLNQ